MKIIKTHWMTRREWVRLHYPHRAQGSAWGGCCGCPIDYGFDGDKACSGSMDKVNRERCALCYDRPAKVDGKYILVREDRRCKRICKN